MRRRLSRGVRIYIHDDKGRTRDSYNVEQGLRELKGYMEMPNCWHLMGVGSEGGAMVAHFRWAGP